MNDPQFVSLRDAFQLTGIGISTLRKLADTQAIRCYKTPSGQRKFHKPSLVELCQPVPPPTQLPVPPQRKNFAVVERDPKTQLASPSATLHTHAKGTEIIEWNDDIS